MKKTDMAMIILITVVSVGLAFGVVSAIPGLQMSDVKEQVPTIDRYTADLQDPSPKIFNDEAINPTVDVTIGGQTSSDE